MGEECKGGGKIQPMSQERLHDGGKQGRASVNCSTDSCGIHALSGVIDTSPPLWYFSARPKSPFIFYSLLEFLFSLLGILFQIASPSL